MLQDGLFSYHSTISTSRRTLLPRRPWRLVQLPSCPVPSTPRCQWCLVFQLAFVMFFFSLCCLFGFLRPPPTGVLEELRAAAAGASAEASFEEREREGERERERARGAPGGLPPCPQERKKERERERERASGPGEPGRQQLKRGRGTNRSQVCMGAGSYRGGHPVSTGFPLSSCHQPRSPEYSTGAGANARGLAPCPQERKQERERYNG